MRSARRSVGLAAQIMRLTLAIGVATVLAASAVAIVGTSRLVEQSIAAKESGSLQSIEDTLLGRLADAQAIASRVGQIAAMAKSPEAMSDSIAEVYPSSRQLVRSIMVVDAVGRPIAAVPSAVTTLPADARAAAFIALLGSPGISRNKALPNAHGMWLSQAVVLSDGRPAALLLSLDTSFVDQLAASAAVDGRSVYLLDRGAPIISRGRTDLRFASAVWTPQAPGAGEVQLVADRGVTLAGRYDDVDGPGGMSWRLVTLQPASHFVSGTVAALLPSALVLTLGGVIALAAAGLIARRLVRPLRALESSALRGATGAYVKPIETTRGDEIGRVAEAFNAVALRLNALHDLSQLLASSSRLDHVLDGILMAMEHIVGPGAAVIYLLDEGGRWLVPSRARGVEISMAPAMDSQRSAWLSGTMSSAEPAWFQLEERTLADEFPGIVSGETGALVAPLVWGGESLGIVLLLRPVSDDIGEAEREMVRTFSAQAAVAVHNSRLFAVEIESRRVAEGLRRVAEHLVRGGGLPGALGDVESTVAELFGAPSVTFAIIDRERLGIPEAGDRQAEREILGFALRALAHFDAPRPFLVRPGDDRASDAIMRRLDARELLIAPVALEGDHGAVMVVGYDDDRASRRDLELAEAVSNEIALSFDNAYFYQQALTRADSLETVLRISQAVGSSLEVKVVLNRVLDVVQKILSADAVALMTYDARRRTITTEMARGAVSPSMVDRVIAPGDDLIGRVFESGEPVAFRDMHESLGGVAGDAARHGLRSMLAVPLLARGRSIGVLTVFSEGEAAFGDEDMNMLQTFASQAALAIDTARLYSREHEVASILQASILPDALPQFDEIESASMYKPAGLDAEIGGDYYDLFRAPDSSIWLCIADVCGKGVVAATKTSMIKYTIRALVTAGYSPGRVIAEVNRIVCERGDTSDIVTVWVGRIDFQRSTIMWSGGGHPPGMLRRSDGSEILRLNATGPLLGAVGTAAYGDETAAIGPEDAIILYTDGVTEARHGNEFFGEERVEKALSPGGTAVDILDRVTTAVRRFAKSELRDDVAVLVVKLRSG